MERLVSIAQSNDDFDLKFWRRAGVSARFRAAWEMLEDYYKIKGIRGYKLRLQRAVQNIQQV